MNSFERMLYRPMVLWAAAFTGGALAGFRYMEDRSADKGIALAAAILLFAAAGVIRIRAGSFSGKQDESGPGNSKEAAGKGSLIIPLSIWLISPVFALFGFFRMYESAYPGDLQKYLDRSTAAEVSGIIEYISVKENGYTLTLSDTCVKIGDSYFYPRKLLMQADASVIGEPAVGLGIEAQGRIYPFERASNPGQFDSYLYYSARNLECRFNASSVKITSDKSGILNNLYYSLGQRLYLIRSYLSENIAKSLPQKEASVLNSMLTGDRGLLESEIKELYSKGGIAHILSISSLHITLLGMGLYRLLLKLIGRMRISAITTIITMICYMLLTGASVSIKRAVIMLTVMLTGKMLGRSYDLLNTAGCAALIILTAQPLFIFDSGFLLSFTAVGGIFAASELIRIWEIKNPVAKSLIMSTSVQLSTLPVVLDTYFCIHPYSLIINIVVLPLMSILLVAGFAAAVSGWLFPAGPVYYILRFYEAVCESEEMLKYSEVITGAPGKIAQAVYYILILSFLICLWEKPYLKNGNGKRNENGNGKRNGKKNEKHGNKDGNRNNYLILAILAGCFCIFIKSPAEKIYAAFLDVGQGDCIYFEAGGESFLMDAGSSNIGSAGKYRAIPFLKHRGITRLERVFISHTDRDHISAVEEIMEEGYPQIGELVVGCNIGEDADIVQKARELGIDVSFTAAGDVFLPGEKIKYSDNENPEVPESDTSGTDNPFEMVNTKNSAIIRILAPEQDKNYKDANSGSVVAELTYGSFSMLLTGDSGFESEALYGERLKHGRYSILKCAHHGSKYSSSSDMLMLARPVITIISCYRYNTYGHPSAETVKRLETAGSAIYTTPSSGAVLIRFNSGIEVEEYRKNSF